MKTERKILIAFILNLFFSIFEIAGGLLTGSTAIISDAFHDFGDAFAIGISYVFEKISKKEKYKDFSDYGGIVTTVILIVGSAVVIINAVTKIFNPTEIIYDKMIGFAIVGVIVNFIAAYITHGGDSLNQRAVNLHMLEDVLGWIVVLIGAVVMNFTDITIIDPIMSIAVAVFILINAIKNLKGGCHHRHH